MKIVHVNDIAGVGTCLVGGLREEGIDAELVTPREPLASRGPMAKISAAPARAWISTLTIRSLRQCQPDLVHIHNARHGLIGRLSGARYVIHCHGTDVRSTRPNKGWGRELAPPLPGAAHVNVSNPPQENAVRAYVV